MILTTTGQRRPDVEVDNPFRGQDRQFDALFVQAVNLQLLRPGAGQEEIVQVVQRLGRVQLANANGAAPAQQPRDVAGPAQDQARDEADRRWVRRFLALAENDEEDLLDSE